MLYLRRHKEFFARCVSTLCWAYCLVGPVDPTYPALCLHGHGDNHSRGWRLVCSTDSREQQPPLYGTAVEWHLVIKREDTPDICFRHWSAVNELSGLNACSQQATLVCKKYADKDDITCFSRAAPDSTSWALDKDTKRTKKKPGHTDGAGQVH